MNLESGVLQVHVEDIIPNRFQPRLTFDEQGLKELADSIRKELLEKYKDVPKHIIENHNNIPEMRSKQNCEFANIKKNLIISILGVLINFGLETNLPNKTTLSLSTNSYSFLVQYSKDSYLYGKYEIKSSEV